MQNTVYERKQNGEDFFSFPAVTYCRFGNRTANGLVTEQPQYSVVVCFFSIPQNIEISLIPNGLRFIYTCLLSLALPCIFHVARHTFAVMALNRGISLHMISQLLGHGSIITTEKVYAQFLPNTINDTVRNQLAFGSFAPTV